MTTTTEITNPHCLGCMMKEIETKYGKRRNVPNEPEVYIPLIRRGINNSDPPIFRVKNRKKK